MSAPANRAGALQRQKAAELGIKNAVISGDCAEIPSPENYRPATSIGGGLFRPSLNLIRRSPGLRAQNSNQKPPRLNPVATFLLCKVE